MGFFLVMKAELVRGWIVARRYWFRTLVSMAIGYGMLMVLVVGIATGGMSEQLSGKFVDPEGATNFVLGFIIGLFAFGVVGMYTQGLQGLARSGVLEQLCLSPHGLITNFMARTFVSAVTTVITSSILVYMVSTSVFFIENREMGNALHFDFVAVPVLLWMTFLNLLGFGLMVGGLVLVFKQVGELAVIVRMALFGLAVFAKEELVAVGGVFAFIMHILPVTDAAICLKYVLIKGQMTDGHFQSVFTHSSFFWLLVNVVLWNSLGVATFKLMENHSRRKGTLGAY